MRVGPPLQFGDVPNEREGWDQLAATLQEAVQRMANAEFGQPADAEAKAE
jgi:hypothetical protein